MLIEQLGEIVNDYRDVLSSYLLSPRKRVYALYLITSLLLAYYVYRKSNLKITFFGYLFKREYWTSESAIVDYLFILFNTLVKVLVIAPFLIYSLTITEGVNEYLISSFGAFSVDISPIALSITYTLSIVIVTDFFTYIIHHLLHRVPFLWKFHKVHHSATVLNPFTQYRIHPVELIISNIKGIVIKGLITGLFFYIANGSISLLTFLGINILDFAFMFVGANLRHSHVRLKYFDFLENILISPFQHQIHHSNKKEHFDTNLGSRLAIWDYLFGTLIKSDSVKEIHFGLGEREDPNYNSFRKNLLAPFKRL
ncbi:MAG: sterol desaturase family protein [Flavobacteriales bacterium]|nr:sterol desaturase family protein [Flavobacteriales bacterium]